MTYAKKTIRVVPIGPKPIDLARHLVEKARESLLSSSENSRWNWRFRQKGWLCHRLELHGGIADDWDTSEWNAAGAASLIEKARTGDKQADAVLREIAVEMLQREIALPAEMRVFVIEILSGDGQRQRRRTNPHKNMLRDATIVHIVNQLIKHKSLRPLRNEASRDHDSACSVTAQALGMTEDAVNKIWQSRKKP